MNTLRRNRLLLVSCVVILLCVCMIAGMSYALFTESVTVKNHLHAADLDIGLYRTYLKYNDLNNDGELEEFEDSTVVDFTTTTFPEKNIFGVNSEGILLVPGSFFTADMKITNDGEVAFEYTVSIILNGDGSTDPAVIARNKALAEQLQVTFKHADGSTTVKRLTELSTGFTIQAGKMKVTDTEQEFTITIDFLDDVVVNRDETPREDWIYNNEAQEGTVWFDLVVSAVQSTTKSN